MKKLGILAIATLFGAVALVGCSKSEEDMNAEMKKVEQAGQGQTPQGGGQGVQDAPQSDLPMPPGKNSGG